MDVIPFIEAIDKTCQHYYPNEIDMLKNAVSIPGLSMMYVLSKSLKMKRPGKWELFAPGQPCFHKCKKCEIDLKPSCEKCKKIWNNCTQCAKNKPYELLKTFMIGGPSIVFAGIMSLESPKSTTILMQKHVTVS